MKVGDDTWAMLLVVMVFWREAKGLVASRP